MNATVDSPPLVWPPSAKPFWRLDDPVMHADGKTVRKGGMWPHQRAWWRLPNKIPLLLGGYGAGKSIQLGKWIIASALLNAPAPVGLVSPSLVFARKSIILTLDDLLAGKRDLLGERKFNYRKRVAPEIAYDVWHENKWGTILLFSGEDPDRIKGANLAEMGIDEPFLMPQAVLRNSIARCRHPQGKRHRIAMTGTPEGLGWGYEVIEGEHAGRYDIGVVRASTRENLALPRDYVADLERGFDDKARAAYIEGQFVNLAEGQVYYAFDPAHNIDGACDTVPHGAELWAGMDFNVDPMAFCVGWVTRGPNGHMHVLAEYEQDTSSTPAACKTLIDDWAKPQGLRYVYPDASAQQRHTNADGAPSDLQAIQGAGFIAQMRPSNPLRRDRYNSVNGMLAHRRLTISPRCRKLRQYMTGLTHSNMNKRGDSGGQRMTHLTDALGYPVHFLFPSDRPTMSVNRLAGV